MNKEIQTSRKLNINTACGSKTISFKLTIFIDRSKIDNFHAYSTVYALVITAISSIIYVASYFFSPDSDSSSHVEDTKHQVFGQRDSSEKCRSFHDAKCSVAASITRPLVSL